MDQRPYRWQTAAICVIALVALAGCSSTPAATSGPGSNPTLAPGATTASGATAAPVVTAAPTVAATKALPTVDLVISGDIAVVAKGTKGQCTLGKDLTGKVIDFGFNAVEADYPGLGEGLFVQERGGGFADIKWWLTPSSGFFSIAAMKGISADNHSITIDVDLGGGTLDKPKKAHIKGTVTCP